MARTTRSKDDEQVHHQQWVKKKPVKDQGNEGGKDQKDTVMMRITRRLLLNVPSDEPVLDLRHEGILMGNMGGPSSQQQNDVLVKLIQEVKATLESRLDRIEDFLVSLDDRFRQMSEAFFRTGGDVSAGLETLHKDMDSLMKRANEVARKAESSRNITKEFVERLDVVVQECDKVLHDRMVHKNWKRTSHPDKVNID
ncbi:hypothetical protein Scep_022463 [Stephania cephalantha]|uniref:Uncharacterized protein n=1 Tax=Stephania cephalantha TaxID=152367 RepID=A0AAP0F677_9MAGN